MIEFKVTGIRVDENGFEVELLEDYGPFIPGNPQMYFRCKKAGDKPYTMKLRFSKADPMYAKVMVMRLGDRYTLPLGTEIQPA